MKTIELEIQKLLLEFRATDIVADRLIQKVESSPAYFVPSVLNELYKFLFRAGYYSTLIAFVARHGRRPGFKIPWPYLLDSLSLGLNPIPGELRTKLKFEIQQRRELHEALLANRLPLIFPEWETSWSDRANLLEKAFDAKKRFMITKLGTLRSQQLFEEEKKILRLLGKTYPRDPEVLAQIAHYQETNAIQIISRYLNEYRGLREVNRKNLIREEENSRQTEEDDKVLNHVVWALKGQSGSMPKEMYYNFAIMFMWFEDYDHALEILDLASRSKGALWLRVELLLKARRFVDLLENLRHVELIFASDPETFFATAYYRSQAYWGLGEKSKALEVMGTLLLARPYYRSAQSLFREWQGVA